VVGRGSAATRPRARPSRPATPPPATGRGPGPAGPGHVGQRSIRSSPSRARSISASQPATTSRPAPDSRRPRSVASAIASVRARASRAAAAAAPASRRAAPAPPAPGRAAAAVPAASGRRARRQHPLDADEHVRRLVADPRRDQPGRPQRIGGGAAWSERTQQAREGHRSSSRSRPDARTAAVVCHPRSPLRPPPDRDLSMPATVAHVVGARPNFMKAAPVDRRRSGTTHPAGRAHRAALRRAHVRHLLPTSSASPSRTSTSGSAPAPTRPRPRRCWSGSRRRRRAPPAVWWCTAT
jgi:serine/arginine repetitive matrix protein 1